MQISFNYIDTKIGEREATRPFLERDHGLVYIAQVVQGDNGFVGRLCQI